MNDDRETKWVYELLKKLTKSTNTSLSKEILEEYQKQKNKTHYIASFSKEKDLLSQWRAYAGDATGVAIAFGSKKGDLYRNLGLCGKTNGVNTSPEGKVTPSTAELGIEYLIYQENEQQRLVDGIINSTNSKSDIKSSAAMLKELVTTFKHPSFFEECEMRITYTPENIKNGKLDHSIECLSSIEYREQNGRIIDYYKFHFSIKAISEIIIGSKSKLTKDAVESFLSSNGFSATNVKYSASSYR